MKDPLRFERRFAFAGALLTLVEVAAIGGPLWAFFPPNERQRWLLSRAAPLALGGAWLIWWVAMRYWRGPLDRVVRARRLGEPVDAAALQLASRVTMRLPRRAGVLRALVTSLALVLLAGLLSARAGFPLRAIATVASVSAFHGLTVQVFRALAWSRILDRVRGALLPDPDALRLFHDLYRPRLWSASLATNALGALATAAFAFFFLPINLEHYIQLETFFPITIFVLVLAWLWIVGRLTRPLETFLAAATSPDPRRHPAPNDPAARAAFATAQSLPYQLGAIKLAIALAGESLLAAQAILLFSVDVETAILLFGEAFVVTVGATLYEVLWHRATLRPVLAHLALRHRPPLDDAPHEARTPFGLRRKMLLGFGGLTFFACGLSLFWSFVQYKTLATAFIQRGTELRRDRLLVTLAARADAAPTRDEAERAIAAAIADEARDAVLVYFLPSDPRFSLLAFGGGKQGAPPLRARDREVMQRLDHGEIDAPDRHLAGTYARLADSHGQTLGSVAVLEPGYRGRGTPIARPIKVLVFFFVLLVAASMGIVVLVANDLTRPIRLLEKRAGAMARGDLNRPVVHVAGELDEVGSLTLAFEEMRRALDQKLRSSTEINLSLEQEVSRRTAELSRRNRELADAILALTRAQAELVRSEKMASMGRLVAGIAHEINNPVNAVVNTVGPLEGALEGLIANHAAGAPATADLHELEGDMREMIRVIRSGARRTKEIVQALHNYSRGDETSQSEVDIHRGLDESLDLLRHHLKHGIHVERAYGPIGRVPGNEGQLQQVFMNLLTNAAQAIGDRAQGGTIRLATERAGDEVVIRVGDDGPGIEPAILPRIFDPFFTTKDVGEGSGLGLSIVHGIVERHGGTIEVESQLGQGTTFTVKLPANRPRIDSRPARRVEAG